MTVPSQTSRDQQNGNDVTTAFTVPFRILADTHIRVLATAAGVTTEKALTTDYTVTRGASTTTITFLVAPASGTTITFLRSVPATQETDYVRNDPFPAESHEAALDKLTMLFQQLDEVAGENGRTIKIPPEVSGVSTVLPVPVASGLWGWDEAAGAPRYYTPAEIGTTLAFSNFIADTFTATPGQVDFTLTADPGAIGNLDVSIDGVTQVPSADYAYTGTTLTFTAAMAGGEVVLARYGTALSSGVSDSSSITFLQAGAGAALRYMQDKARESVSVLDFIPPSEHAAIRAGTSVLNVATYFTAAITAAVAAGRAALYIPAGLYCIGSTVQINDRIILHGDGDYSRLKPTMSDGSPCLDVVTNTNFFAMRDFRVDSGINVANFLTGSINAQNCIGIRIRSTGGTFSARYSITNVHARGCKTGWDIQGFIGTLENVWATACETGLSGTTMNSTRAHLRFEECRKDFAITSSNGLHIDQMISEGGVLQSGLLTSSIDGCNGVTITAPYFEQVRNVPFITFGATTQCLGVTINGISVAMTDNASANYEIFPLAFDQVDGLSIGGYFSTGAHHNFYSVTANTKNIVDQSIAASVATWGPHDASKNLSVVRNHFPNPNFDLWFCGWPNVTVTRATASQDTTNVRRGLNAVKLTMTAAQTDGSINWTFNDSYLGVKLRGKTVSFYAWIWIPNLSGFDPNQGSAQVIQPYISIFTDGTGGTTTASGTHHNQRNAWNLFKVSATVPTDATRIDLSACMSINSGSAAGSENFSIDSCFLVEGSGQDIAIRNGWVSDSDLNPCKGIGGLAIIRGDAAPTDADQTYEVGVEVRKRTAVAGASPGWVCTTAGAGGTAVFKAMPAVAA